MNVTSWFLRGGLKAKLAGMMLALGLVPLLLIGAVADYTCRTGLTDAASARLEQEAKNTLGSVDRLLFERYGDAQAFAFALRSVTAPKEMAGVLDSYVKMYGCYDLIVVAGPDGKVAAVNTVNHEGRPVDTGWIVGQSVRGDDWFEACISGKIRDDQTHCEDVKEDRWSARVNGNRGMVVTYSAPIRDAQNKILGVISNRVAFARTIVPMIATYRMNGEKGPLQQDAQLLSKNGLLLDDAASSDVLKVNLADLGLQAAHEASRGKSGVTFERHRRSGAMQYNGYAQSKGFEAFPGFGWIMLVRADQSVCEATANQLRKQGLLLVAVTAGVLCFVVFRLASSLVTPLVQAAAAMSQLADGDLKANLPIKRSDEIGQMAGALNSLVAQLHGALGADKVNWAELGAKRSEAAKLSCMIENMDAVVTFCDLDGKVTYANPSAIAMFKKLEKFLPVRASEVVGSSIDIFHKKPEHQRRLLTDPKNFPLQSRVSMGDQTFDLVASAIFDQNKKYIGVLLSWDCVTEKLKSETELKDLSNREIEKAKDLREKVESLLELVHAAAAGDLTQTTSVTGDDAIGRMGVALSELMERLRTNLSVIADSTGLLTHASEELSGVSMQLNANASETSVKISEVSLSSENISQHTQMVASSIEEMGVSIREIAKNASDAARVTDTAVKVAEETTAIILKLGDSSTEIGNVIKVITSIAQQTNLLALNATIEAARAGEAGKGFAVVANEVKELAKETAKATEDISRRIVAIQDDTKGAIGAITQISEVINQVSSISSTIASAVEEQTATTNEISRNVVESSRGTEEIAHNISLIATSATNTSEGVARCMRSAEELAQMASDLQKLVAQYRLEDPTPSEHARPADERPRQDERDLKSGIRKYKAIANGSKA